MPLKLLQCIGQSPTTKNYPAKNVNLGNGQKNKKPARGVAGVEVWRQ